MSENNKNILDLQQLNKSYLQGDRCIEVLKGINLKFYKGKWYTLYGSSGSGKTTLLNIIGGIEKPDSGKILYGNDDIYSMKDAALSWWRNFKIGFVFQFFNLIPELTVEKNINLPLYINNIKPDKTWFDNIVDILQVRELLDRKPSTLSGGEKQRIAMARAVINKPDFLLADEPTGNLDSDNSKGVIDLMKQLQTESDVGIILATHERELIDSGICRLHLEDGYIVSDSV
ncbi:ABC transporter ATP-binding protein [Elusimicrobiota bacterium]